MTPIMPLRTGRPRGAAAGVAATRTRMCGPVWARLEQTLRQGLSGVYAAEPMLGTYGKRTPDTQHLTERDAGRAGPRMESAMDPRTTALILVGYQNDYFAQDGILRGVVEEPNRVDQVLADTLAFIQRAAPTAMTIISTPIVLESDYRALADPIGILNSIKESGAFKAGTAGADTIPELVAFGDRVMSITGKVGFNAFSNTALESVLAERGIHDVLVAGMVTSLCIDSTGRAAYERGYNVTILSDCTSGRTPGEQDFYCRNIFPLYGQVACSSDVALDAVAVAV